MKLKGYFLAALSAFTYGMIPLFAIPLKQTDFSFDTVLFYRFIFSTFMVGLFLLYNKVDLKISLKELGVLSLLGIVFSLSSHFLFLGYDYMPAGVASTILFLYPVLVAIIMGIGFKEKISWVVWIAILLSFIGVGALNSGNDADKIPYIGIFIVFLSALAYAVYMIIVNKSCINDMDGTKVTFYSMFICSTVFLCKSLFSGGFALIPSFEIGVNLVMFAAVTGVVSLLAMVYAIRIVGPTTTAILGSLEPVVAVAISVVIFREPLTHSLVAGIALIICAVMLTILSDYRKNSRKASV